MIASASQLQLLDVCPGSAALPRTATTSMAAREGTALHREALPVLVGDAAPETDFERELAHVPDGRGAVIEQAVAVRVGGAGSARLLHTIGDRDYSDVQPDELALTVDAVRLAPDPWVGELKTGAVWVEPLRRNLQVQLAALAVFFLLGRLPRATLVQAGRPLRVERRQYTARELYACRDRLRGLAERIERARAAVATGAEPALVVGEHCGYCPCVLTCPAIERAVGDDPGAQYAQGKALVARGKELQRLALSTVPARPLQLPDGGRVEHQLRARREYNPDAVMTVLETEFGKPAARAVVKVAPAVTAGDLDAFAESRPELGKSRAARRRAMDAMLTMSGALSHREYWTAVTRRGQPDD